MVPCLEQQPSSIPSKDALAKFLACQKNVSANYSLDPKNKLKQIDSRSTNIGTTYPNHSLNNTTATPTTNFDTSLNNAFVRPTAPLHKVKVENGTQPKDPTSNKRKRTKGKMKTQNKTHKQAVESPTSSKYESLSNDSSRSVSIVSNGWGSDSDVEMFAEQRAKLLKATSQQAFRRGNRQHTSTENSWFRGQENRESAWENDVVGEGMNFGVESEEQLEREKIEERWRGRGRRGRGGWRGRRGRGKRKRG